MRGAPRTWTGRTLILGLPGLLLLTALLPALAGAAPASPPGWASHGFTPATPFAERAGYDPGVAPVIVDPSPAVGEMSVVVAFVPSSPTFYDPPVAGTPAMSPAQIAAQYGLAPGTYASAEAYFESRGLVVQHAWPDRLSLTLEGPAPAVATAFGTTLLSGQYENRWVTYPAVPPALPAGLEGEIAGVVGLSTGFTTFSLPLTAPPTSTGAIPGQGATNLITPGIARQIYDVSNLYNYSGSARYALGETIVLLLWGDGYSPNDLTTFYSSYYPSTFPRVSYTPYPVDGAPMPSASATSDPSGAPQELTLDLEWSGSLAPGANLDAVYAPDGPASDQYSPTVSAMTDALNEALTGISGVDVISMSFGTAEGSGGGLEAAWTNDLAEAMHEHITVLAATGDTGGDAAVNPCSGGPSPEFPAVSPDVLAVGGTDPTLQTNPLGQVTGIASESAWAFSGGGYSTQIAAPSWQLVGSAAQPIETTGADHRGIPDVSAAAADDFVYYDGSERVGEGTSFATPLWGGMIAEMNAQRGASLGWVDGPLYSVGAAEPQGAIPTGLVDITSGANCLGPAGPGWDTATGWGSPRAVALYADLTASIVNVTLSASPVPAGPGSSVTLTVTVLNATDRRPMVGVPVLVTLTADTTIGPCEGSFGSDEPSTNASGQVAVSFTVPACYLGSKAVASAQVTADGLYGAAQAVLAVNLLGYLSFLGPLATPPGDVILYAIIMGAAIAIGGYLGSEPRRARLAVPSAPATVSAGPSPPASAPPPPGPPPGAAEPPPSAPADLAPPAGPPAAPPPAPPTPASPEAPDGSFSEEST
jgi:kumamolisin